MSVSSFRAASCMRMRERARKLLRRAATTLDSGELAAGAAVAPDVAAEPALSMHKHGDTPALLWRAWQALLMQVLEPCMDGQRGGRQARERQQAAC